MIQHVPHATTYFTLILLISLAPMDDMDKLNHILNFTIALHKKQPWQSISGYYGYSYIMAALYFMNCKKKETLAHLYRTRVSKKVTLLKFFEEVIIYFGYKA